MNELIQVNKRYQQNQRFKSQTFNNNQLVKTGKP